MLRASLPNFSALSSRTSFPYRQHNTGAIPDASFRESTRFCSSIIIYRLRCALRGKKKKNSNQKEEMTSSNTVLEFSIRFLRLLASSSSSLLDYIIFIYISRNCWHPRWWLSSFYDVSRDKKVKKKSLLNFMTRLYRHQEKICRRRFRNPLACAKKGGVHRVMCWHFPFVFLRREQLQHAQTCLISLYISSDKIHTGYGDSSTRHFDARSVAARRVKLGCLQRTCPVLPRSSLVDWFLSLSLSFFLSFFL